VSALPQPSLASRGIGAHLSKAYRQVGYQVIASSRSMRESDDPAILVIEIMGRAQDLIPNGPKCQLHIEPWRRQMFEQRGRVRAVGPLTVFGGQAGFLGVSY
jgi:hypothetical protein